MKNFLLSILLFLSVATYSASPTKVVRVASSSTQIGEPLSKGNILINISTGTIYLVKASVLATKTINDLIEDADYNTLYHSGNSNRSTVNWSANNITASGTI